MQQVARPSTATTPFAPPPAASRPPLDPAHAPPPPLGPLSPPDPDTKTKEPDLRLELLLLSGKRARVPVDRDDTVRDVLDRVWTDWPHEWCATDPPPASATDLRLLHLGRFLEPKATLVDAGLAPSPQPHAHEGDADAAADARPPVVHLHVRTLRPPDTPPRGGGKVKQGVADDTDDEASCCACCIVS